MRFSSPSILLASILLRATQVAHAFYIKLPTRSEAALPNLLARAPNATSGLDYNNAEGGYYINITLGGREFSVLVDTGRLGSKSNLPPPICAQFSPFLPLVQIKNNASSDLWVAGTVPNANSTGASTEIDYDIGSDEGARAFFSVCPNTCLTSLTLSKGPIQTADLTLLGYTVPDQAFSTRALGIFFASCTDRRRFIVEVTPSSDSPEGYGLIGLGPSIASVVLGTLNNSAGDPPIDRIFRQDTSVPNFISVLLNRPNDTREAYTGEMTIGEVLPLFQNISSQPRVPVTVLPSNLNDASQHFSVLLDPDGIIGPGGNAIKTTSNASLAPSHDSRQLQVSLDTGFSLPQLPE